LVRELRGPCRRYLVAGLLGLCLPLGCQGRGSRPTEYVVEPAPVVAAEARATGERLYGERCARCHGASGAGDGPEAASVHPRPQRLTDRVWQANVSNARLRKVLIFGGGSVGKSPRMPGYADLAKQPEVVDALVAIVRSFAAPQPAAAGPAAQ
jgi:high-affinity iron transporter